MYFDSDNSLLLSPYQELLFYEWELATEGYYNVFFIQELQGQIDRDRLNVAWEKMMMDILPFRSSISKEHSELSVNILDKFNSVVYIDHPLVLEEIKLLIKQPFNLVGQKNLLRLYVIKTDVDSYRILFVFHHFTGGGMSTNAIVDLLSHYYNNPHFQYPVSLEVQQQENLIFLKKTKSLLDTHRDKLIDFWRRNIGGGEGISLDFLKGTSTSSQGDTKDKIFRYYPVPIKYVGSIKHLVRQYHTTEYVFHLTLFAILFHKHVYEPPEKLLLSIPYLINNKLYIQGVNTVLIPFTIKSTKTFLNILEDTHLFFKAISQSLIAGEDVLPAYTPTYLIMETAGIHKDSSLVGISKQPPLSKRVYHFNGMKLKEEKYPISESSMFSGHLHIRIQRVDEQQIHFFIDTEDIDINIELVDSFFQRYFKLLEDVLSDASKTIGEYNMITDKEYQYLVYDYNKTEREYPKDKTIHQLFEEQVARTPNNIAVVFEEKELTYQELNNKANQLAYYLYHNYQTKADDIICLLLERSEWMIIAILGVLKSGAAYCPISPEYPEERILFILQDTQPKCLITNCKLKIENVQFVIVNLTDEQFLKELYSLTINHLPLTINSHALAYIIYTSGTTGNPKGVMVEHRNVVNYLFWMKVDNYFLGVNNIDASIEYFFDALAQVLFTPLVEGKKVVIASQDRKRDIVIYVNYLIDNKIELIKVTPSYLEWLVDELLNDEWKESICLRKIIVGGERTNLILRNRLSSLPYEIIHHYGPTEATIGCLSMLIDKNKLPDFFSLGKFTHNINGYILNNNLQLLPIGSMGELYIGGDGVARGYLNKPELTAERFIKNPFQTEEDKKKNRNSRLYKTGDVVRMLPDGNIEYIGRNDFQVKIRGYRIELGEIETRIQGFQTRIEGLKDEQVIEQAVVLVNDKGDNKYLVGYFVAKEQVDVEELRSYLSKQLPDYMVPIGLVQIEQMPLTVNGKLDRKALLTMEYNLTDSKEYKAPKNELEQKLLSIWEKLLGNNNIGVQDDLFRVGGDSITSIQLSSRVRSELGKELSVKDVFEHRTIERMVAQVLSNHQIKVYLSEQGKLSGELPLLPIQQYFFELKLNNEHHYNQSFLIETPELEIEKLKIAIEKVVEQHDAFRLTYKKDAEGNIIQYYDSEREAISLDVLDISEWNVQEGTVVFEEKLKKQYTSWQDGFNIYEGRTYQISYIWGYKNKIARIFIAAHHLIIDAVSWRILLEDIEAVYKGKKLLAKRTSYRQWVNIGKDYVSHYPNELNYWEEVEKRVQENIIKLSSKITIQEESYFTTIAIDSDITNYLLLSANQVFHTEINDLLLTALARALGKLFNEQEVSILLEGHGRESLQDDIDISKTMGWFTSIVPIHLLIYDNVQESIIEVKEGLRRIPNKGIGYGFIRGYKHLPKISFNYLGVFKKEEQQDWFLTNESSGISVSNKNKSNLWLDINGGVGANGILEFSIRGRLTNEYIDTVSMYFKQEMIAIANYTQSVNRSYLTPSDTHYIVSKDLLNRLQIDNDIQAIYVANSLQAGFIYHYLSKSEGDDAYKVQLLWKYKSQVNKDYFIQSWQQALDRYPGLRVRFNWEEEIVQIIDKKVTLDYRFRDIQDKRNKEKAIEGIRIADRKEDYDLAKGNLLRVYLIQVDKEEFVVLYSNHHAISDGWSNPNLLNYIHEVYNSLINQNTPIELLEEQAYLRAQEYLQVKSKNNTHDRWWVDYLSGVERTIEVRGLRKQEANGINLLDYKFIQEPISKIIKIKDKEYSALSNFIKQEGLTWSNLIMWCWSKALSIYDNRHENIIGITLSGRGLPINDIEQSVGLYINTLPLVVRHDSNESILNILKNIQKDTEQLNQLTHTHLSGLHSNASDRLFATMVVYENYPIPTNKDNQEVNTLMPIFLSSVAKIDYPLTILVYEKDGILSVEIKYAGELFEEKQIERLLKLVSLLLQQIPIGYNKLEQELRLIDNEEYNYLVYDYNKTEKEYPKDKTIHQLFEEQVTRTPNNIAVVFEDKKLTYQELNNKANQLANYLHNNYQTKADDIICLLLERSEWMIVSILGVLKSGAAYCPISPEYPEERLLFILHDTQPKCLITNCKLKIENIQFAIVNLTDEQFLKELYSLTINHLPLIISPHALAYIIYTSGTTGNPKGVMIEHATFSHAIQNLVAVFSKSLTSFNTYSTTHYTFDIFGLEYTLPLLHGDVLALGNMHENLDFNSYDFVQITPTVLQSYLSNINKINPDLIWLIGGEKVPIVLLIDILKKSAKREVNIYNVYGPTETTIWSIVYFYNRRAIELGIESIGKPIDNTVVYILDSDKKLLPMGAMGELYIGGDGVARGYLNRSELTAEKFISNPFQTEEEKQQNRNSKLYKTGDIVRMLPDGNIEYIGRNDFQVKIRGYRIELGEIETRIQRFQTRIEGLKDEQVIEQAVVLVNEKADNKYLVGYFVAKEQVNVDELRSYLSKQLPEYMVPIGLVQIEQMPLTVNGKLDRKALLNIEYKITDEVIELPKNDTEERLLKIWSNLLQIAELELSVTQSFFRLGGNSILSIRLMNLINKEFNTSFSVRIIFERNTIRQLAEYLLEGNIEIIAVQKQSFNSEEEQVLSYAQNRLWFVYQYDKANSAVYNIPMVFELNKSVDKEKLKESLLFVVQKHEILRTIIEENERGISYQSVKAISDSLIREEIYSSKSDVESKILSAIRYLFQLDKELPIQIKFFIPKNKDGKIVLTIVIHHIAFDGWSVEVFQREVYHAYQSLVNQKSLTHATNIQYKDYALWQRNFLQGERWDKELSYWKEQLEGYNNSHLPIDFSRPLQMNYEGDGMVVLLSKETSQNLKAIAKELNASLYSVLLSGYYLFLSAYSNEQDIVVGSPFANRHYAGTEDMIGFFVNSLALRVQIDFKDTLKAYIEKVNAIVERGQNNQDIPFEQLVEELHVERDTSRHPIFQIMFGVQNFGGDDTILFRSYQSNRTNIIPAKFDITTMVSEVEDGLQIYFNYATALYKREIIERFVKTYEFILTQIVREQLNSNLNSIRFIDDREYNYLVYDYNKTEKEYPKDKTIHQLFEEQVTRTPNNIAVVFEDKQLTYQELNNKANQLANYLHHNYDTKADDIVCLLLERSEWMIIAILGVLKSGAAYCPISPEYPEERILFVLQDTQPKCLITNCKLKIENVQFLIVNLMDEEFLKVLVSLTINHLPLTINSHALAYIIYTSGTTGNPKGVMVEHKSIINLVFAQSKEWGIHTATNMIFIKTLFFVNIVFDPHVSEIFSTLLFGHCGYLVNEGKQKNISELNDYVIDQSIVLATLPSALLNTDVVLPLLKLIIGGEVPMQAKIEAYQKRGTKIFNSYGVTEVTVCTTMNVYIKKSSTKDIGKPIANQYVYILSHNKKLLPIGSMGELYIGGDGLARGYLNRPELTAERFIKNPFQTEEDKKKNRNGRLYKTGDIVRMLPDGNIEYIGRNDFQVKIRGYRIELGEIENKIQGFQIRIQGFQDFRMIEQAVVLVNEKGDNKYLVGYFVAKEQVDVEELRSYLSKKLPEYMVPTGLVQIEQMPLTVNGKLDRKALLNIEYKISDEVIELPKNNIEERLLKIWSNLLQIVESELSVMQSFFRLGGNSILSIRLMNLINKEFNTSFSVRIIFERNTIRQLAEYLLSDNTEKIAITKQVFNSEEEQILSYAQNRLWFIYQYDKKNSAVYNIPMVFEMDKVLDKEKLKEALLFVVEKHEILRTTIEENENGIIYQSVKAIPDNLIQEEIYSGKRDVENKILSAIRYSFQLDKELPIQIKFFMPKKKGGKIVLTIVIHHIAFDGWSVEVFQKEVYHVYQSLVNQKSLTHATNIQYKDYALWQRNFLQGERWDKELSYWKEQLEGYNNSHLPIDFSRPLQMNYEGDGMVVLLSKETSQNLKVVAKQLNVSLYSVLLSGYYLFLSVYSNEQDIVVGTPFANRHYAGTEDMIGFFVNSLALRIQIDFKDTLKAYIEKVNATVTQGQNNQDIPFEQLVEELQVERDTSRHPIFQIMFGVQNFGGDDTILFKSYQSNRTNIIPAKFDITTMVSEVKDGLQIYFNYATALYKRETIDRFVKTYEFILTQIVRDRLDNDLKSIRFVNNEEYNYLIYDYNKTEREYPKDKTIHQLFEEQVVRAPNNIAVVFEEKQLTYQELNDKANQLANYLHNNYQTKADDIICLLLERSEWMIIAILGVLKSGAAYCPISSEYPEERILFILQDTQPKCLITNCKLKIENVQFLIVNLMDEEFLKVLASLTINHLPLIISSHALAYIIYTSGTTGNPKGVMVDHSNVVSLVKGVDYVKLDSYSFTIQLSDICFDAFTFELWGMLLNGGKIYVPKDIKNMLEVQIFKRYCVEHNINTLWLTKTLFEALYLQDDTLFRHLTYLLVGGEALNSALVQQLMCANGPQFFINGYGPTENTTFSLTYTCSKNNKNQNIPIGKPLNNRTAFVVSNNNSLLPIGAIGELYLGGDGLSRGYLNRSELTAERFIQNPFQTEEEKKKNRNNRLYKTGDVVRMLPDGNIEYIGRNDFQVKIRGYRIELGEIEIRIQGFQDFRIIEQVVVLFNEKADNKYLVGYFVAKEQVDVEELRSYLSKKLPEYMVPTRLLQIEQMPLTVNGKLDRKILLNMEVNFVGENIQAPTNKLELRILQIFAILLSLESNTISVTNSFFRLGGNSILSIRLASLLNREFGTFLSVVDIFKYPTIRELAVQVNYKKTSFDLVLMLNNSVAKQAIYMIHPGRAGAEVYYNMAYRLQESYSCYGIGNYNLFSENKISEISLLAKHYLHEIRNNTIIEPCILLGWSLGGKIALEMAYHLEQQGIKDIVVYLLDNIVMDETLINILNKKDLSFRKQALSKLLDNLNVGEDYKQRVLANSSIEEKLNNDALTGKLIYSRCVLFKAMLIGKNDIPDLFQYKLSLPYNNVDKFVSIENIKLIEMQVSHQDIIKKEDEIVDIIKRMGNGLNK